MAITDGEFRAPSGLATRRRANSDARAGPPGTLTMQESEIHILLVSTRPKSEIRILLVSTRAISLQHAQ